MSIEKVIVKESTIFNLDSSLLENVSGYKLNILSRAIDISQYGAIFACAQKNIGPSGLSIVIIRSDL